jgi:hypothetical protein
MNPINSTNLDNPMLSALCPMRFSRVRQGFSYASCKGGVRGEGVKQDPNADFGLRLRLHPRGASAPEGEPSGSERVQNAESETDRKIG